MVGSREQNSFLEIILLTAEFSKILVSRNSECKTELMEKFTIEILVLLGVLWQITNTRLLVMCVGSFYFI